MPNTILKRWNGTAFEELYPKTTVGQISASGTANSDTFLRGDGQWATPATIGHAHGNISNLGAISSATVTPANDDRILIADASNATFGKIERGIIIGTGTTTFLRNDGTWATPADSTTLAGLGITATSAELNFVDGVTSAIQTQLNGKAATSHTHTASQISDRGNIGNNLMVLQNTSASTRFLKLNPDHSISLESDATFQTSLDIVTKAGSQTITGAKTFSTTAVLSRNASTAQSFGLNFQTGAAYGGPTIRGNGENLERTYYTTTATIFDIQNSVAWDTLRYRGDSVSLTTTGCSGTTGGSIAAGDTLAQGDTIMMEVSDTAAVTAGNTPNIVIFTLGAADTVPDSITQGITYRSSYSSSLVHYDYFFKVSHSGSTLYFDDSFRITFTDTSTASSIITQTAVTLHVGRIWRLYDQL